jgi:16S rRNA (uracil1498-N3)-methyltransferase
MTRKCFLLEDENPEVGGVVTLSESTAHHVRHVLRLRPGERIELRDGRGHGWYAVIQEMHGQGIRVAVEEKQVIQRESSLRVTLALAFSRSDRMELALRQATEMGVDRFVTFGAERSDYRLAGARMERRIDRWRKITGEALCQCGRMRLPEIVMLSDTADLISHAAAWNLVDGEGLKILAKEEGERQSLTSLSDRYPVCRRMLVAVGPEGGWSKVEGAQFGEAGFDAVHLGPRILRLETAVVALLAAAQLLWGDFI